MTAHSVSEARARRALAHRIDLIVNSETFVVTVGMLIVVSPAFVLVLAMLGLLPASFWGF
jgi:hypothetical protein